MPANISQIDIADLRSRIASSRISIVDKCRALEELLEFYPSERNKVIAYRYIKRWLKTGGCKKEATKLKAKLLREAILENRIRLKQKQKASTEPVATPPPGAVGTAPGSDGNDYYVDATGNILGRAPKA
jgi:type III secretory pathway component EscV